MQVDVQEQTPSGTSGLLGFEELSLNELPLSAKEVSESKIRQENIHRLSDVTSVEASVTDSYNATGYWDVMSVRGYTLDNKFNYRREGLLISAETSVPLDNKAGIDVLKGLSAVQAGASSPGGIINYNVKRPTGKNIREVHTEITDSGNILTGIDVGGSVDQYGYRLNLAQEKLDPHLKDAKGDRSFASFAGDVRLPHESLLEVEAEWSRRSQPSQAAFSLLGSKLPDPVDPRLNLNDQPWSQPVVFTGSTGTARFTQMIAGTWNWSAIVGVQTLGTDDHLAYPFGCSAENNYDRYCSDGTYDMYDYRSDNESRVTQAAKISTQGQIKTAEVSHNLSVGVMGSSTKERYQGQAYNFVGKGNVDGTTILPANPATNDPNTNRDAKSIEGFVTESAAWGKWRGWLGLRMDYLERSSERTDGSRPVSYSQNFAIPWGALAYNFDSMMGYISMGDGLESFVTPNKSGYDYPGEFLADVRSHQIELGLKGEGAVNWSVSAFEINRPVVTDQPPYYQADGVDRHRGVEAAGDYRWQRWDFGASVMTLQARREDGDLNPSLNGKRPVNVPEYTLRIGVNYQTPWVQGLSLNSRVVREGSRAVVADNSIMLPSWTRVDAGVAYSQKWWNTPTLARLSVENIADQRYWRESPTQYGHIYLYPGEGRSFLLSLQAWL